VTGDRFHESDENFFIDLRTARGARIGDGPGVVTVLDDEQRVSISDARNPAEEAVSFTVTLATAYDQAVTVAFATTDGSAVAGGDYVAAAGTLTFAPGETTKTVAVTVIDLAGAGYKSFYVQLRYPSANTVISDAQGIQCLWYSLSGVGLGAAFFASIAGRP
jgi:hypothetical protein